MEAAHRPLGWTGGGRNLSGGDRVIPEPSPYTLASPPVAIPPPIWCCMKAAATRSSGCENRCENTRPGANQAAARHRGENMGRWAIITNPIAGGFSEKGLEAVRSVLAGGGVETVVHPTTGPGHATEIGRTVSGVERVAVFGGDGTLNEAAEGLLGRGIPLAFIPGGSANSMAGELGLPRRPAAAARALLGSRPVPIRPGRVDGRHFLMMAGFGFDGLAIHLISSRLKNRMGSLGYVLTGFRCLVHRHAPLRVETPSGTRRGIWAVASRSGRYAGILTIHPRASLRSPALGLTVVNGWMLVPFGIGRLLLRLPVRGPGLTLEEHQAFTVVSDTPVHAHLDGDYYREGTRFEVGISEQELPFCFPEI